MATDPLMTPFCLKTLTLRNRIVSTSHEPAYSEDGLPKDRYRAYHVEKAKGGVAPSPAATPPGCAGRSDERPPAWLVESAKSTEPLSRTRFPIFELARQLLRRREPNCLQPQRHGRQHVLGAVVDKQYGPGRCA